MKHIFHIGLLSLLTVSPASASLPESNAPTATQSASKLSAKELILHASGLVQKSQGEADLEQKAALLGASADLYAQVANDTNFIGDHISIVASAAHIYVRAARTSTNPQKKNEYYTKSLPFWNTLQEKSELSEIDAPYAIEAYEAAGDHGAAQRVKLLHALDN